MAVSKLGPFADNVPIVRQDGTPTPEFVRQLETLLAEKAVTDALATDAVPQGRLINTTSPLTGGGDLTADLTIALDTAVEDERIQDMLNTFLVAGSNVTLTYDDTANTLTIASSGGGGGGTWTAYNVATAGDSFIGVPLDSDGGTAYEVFCKLVPSSDASFGVRVSDDNGSTWKSGASDYKSGSGGSASSMGLQSTVGSGRRSSAQFKIWGLNGGVSGSSFSMTSQWYAVSSTGSASSGTSGGCNNGLGAGDYNAFEVFASAGNMDGCTIWVKKIA